MLIPGELMKINENNDLINENNDLINENNGYCQ